MIQYKKLRLSGFKSFLYPTEIDIAPGMNGVVGPNGCGKSNLLEAMGWVMGETSAKKMRGGEMDDVIFGGTDSKPARNHAEVSILLDNKTRSAPALFNHLDEIEVTRRIERGAGSDYKINGKSVRAKDVQLLFADLVSGASSPALVSQGRITAIISAKPTERRKILEDAAGISGLHARKHEAELKLRGTNNNLDRLDDLLNNMESQLSGLKKQARQANRYRNIANQIKEIESLIAILRWQSVQIDQQDGKASFQDQEKAITELMSVIAGLNKDQAEQAASLPDLRRQEAEIAAKLQKLLLTKEQYEHDVARIARELNETAERIEHIKQDINGEQNALNNATDLSEKLQTEKRDLHSHYEENISGLGQKQENIESYAKEMAEQEAQTETMKRALIMAESEAKNLLSQKLGLEEQIAGQNREISTLKNQLADLQKSLPETDSLNKFEQTLSSLLEKLSQLRETSQNRLKTIEETEQKRELIDAAYRKEKSSYDRLVAEKDALQQLLAKTATDSDIVSALDQIKVQNGYENALAVALGETLEYAVDAVDKEKSLADNQNVTRYWQALATVPNNQDQTISLPENVPPLADFVQNATILKRALSQIGVVENLAQGHSMSKRLKIGQSLVTKQGDFWRWDGVVTKADAPSAAAMRLQQRNRLQQLDTEITKQDKSVNKAYENLVAIQSQLQDTRQSATQDRQEITECEGQIEENRKSIEQIKSRQEHYRQEINATEASIRMMQENVENATKLKQSIMAQLDATENLDEQRASLQQMQDSLAEKRSTHAQMVQELQRIHIENQNRENRLSAIDREIKAAQETVAKAQERMTILQKRLAKEEKRLAELNDAPAQSPDKIADLTDHIQTQEKQRQDATDRLVQAETKLKEIESHLRRNEQSMADFREKRAHIQARLAALVEQNQQIEQEILEKFETTPQQLQRNLEQTLEISDDKSSLQAKLEKLWRERDNMGPVNLRAEIEATELEKDIEKITHEKAELIEAIQKLRQAIQKLNREARARLLQAFGEVDNHFRTLFSRLFRGGQAYLKLTDSDDPLEAGLEIFAQPPGKKLQNLTLLSGGEQTLTSIALVFAMFLTNPSPICVLDEIDAALDDANVDRVCGLIEEIAKKGDTRFLIISHHRMTISRMDRLYGVTMAEKGISQLVSVDLRQADLLDEVA